MKGKLSFKMCQLFSHTEGGVLLWVSGYVHIQCVPLCSE